MMIVENELCPPLPGIGRIIRFENMKTCFAAQISCLCKGSEAIRPTLGSNASATSIDRGQIGRDADIQVHGFAQAKYASRAQDTINLGETILIKVHAKQAAHHLKRGRGMDEIKCVSRKPRVRHTCFQPNHLVCKLPIDDAALEMFHMRNAIHTVITWIDGDHEEIIFLGKETGLIAVFDANIEQTRPGRKCIFSAMNSVSCKPPGPLHSM